MSGLRMKLNFATIFKNCKHFLPIFLDYTPTKCIQFPQHQFNWTYNYVQRSWKLGWLKIVCHKLDLKKIELCQFVQLPFNTIQSQPIEHQGGQIGAGTHLVTLITEYQDQERTKPWPSYYQCQIWPHNGAFYWTWPSSPRCIHILALFTEVASQTGDVNVLLYRQAK